MASEDPRVGRPPLPRTKSSESLQFYEPSSRIKTSAEIIRDAKLSIETNRAFKQPRTVHSTRRPITPAQINRNLFTRASSNDPKRPSSAINFFGHYSDTEEICSREEFARQLKRNPSEENAVSLPVSPVPRGKLRPLSTIHVSLTCEDVQKKLREIEGSPAGEISNKIQRLQDGEKFPSRPNSSRASNTRRNNGSESGYSSRMSSANLSADTISLQSVSTDDIATDGETEIYQNEILPILNSITSSAADGETLLQLADRLLDLCQTHAQIFEKRTAHRSYILKILYRHLNEAKPQLCIKLATIILTMKVTGTNLNNLSKLIYALSKIGENDSHFCDPQFLESLVSAVSRCSAETNEATLLFIFGALKFLSGNKDVMKFLIDLPTIQVLTNVTQSILEMQKSELAVDGNRGNLNFAHILVQIVSIIRNLLDFGSKGRQKILTLGTLPLLVDVLAIFPLDRELCLIVSRILSKISLSEDSCQQLESIPNLYKNCVMILQIYYRKQDVCVRILFVLGNLLSFSEAAQKELFEVNGVLDTLGKIFSHFVDVDRHLSGDISETESLMSSSSTRNAVQTEDLLIKLVRVLANLSVYQEAGEKMSTDDRLVKLLITVLTSKTVTESEELVINTVVALSNLSYYEITSSSLLKYHDVILERLCNNIFSSHTRATTEALTVMGNLSRQPEVLTWLYDRKAVPVILQFLDVASSYDCIGAACGVVINMTLEDNLALSLVEHDIYDRLIGMLAAVNNWAVRGLVCQICWNLVCNEATKGRLREEEIFELTRLCFTFTDEINRPTDETELRNWDEDFCAVAIPLLELLANCIS